MSFFLFYIFSGITLFASFFVVSVINPVHSVLFLILTFISTSGILFLLQLEFISLIFIIVYVGAIAVLFLFVVMMLNIKLATRAPDFFKYLPLGSFIGGFFFLVILCKLNDYFVLPQNNTLSFQENFWFAYLDKVTNLETFGQILYTDFFILFLISGVVLLVAMVGAIVLTLEFNKKVKSQYLFRQLSRNSQKAIFLIRN